LPFLIVNSLTLKGFSHAAADLWSACGATSRSSTRLLRCPPDFCFGKSQNLYAESVTLDLR